MILLNRIKFTTGWN